MGGFGMKALIAMIAMTGAALAAPFSHQVHLQLRPDCGSCHAAAASSTSPADSLMPRPDVCRSCHQPTPAIKQPPVTRVVKFSHAQHGRLGNVAPLLASAIDSKTYLTLPAEAIRRTLGTKNACAACHHGIEESDEVSRANMPQMADCLVCHNKIENPFSCEQCHTPGPHLRPNTHTPAFLEEHNSTAMKGKLDKSTCAVCHGRQFLCMGCHTP